MGNIPRNILANIVLGGIAYVILFGMSYAVDLDPKELLGFQVLGMFILAAVAALTHQVGRHLQAWFLYVVAIGVFLFQQI